MPSEVSRRWGDPTRLEPPDVEYVQHGAPNVPLAQRCETCALRRQCPMLKDAMQRMQWLAPQGFTRGGTAPKLPPGLPMPCGGREYQAAPEKVESTHPLLQRLGVNQVPSLDPSLRREAQRNFRDHPPQKQATLPDDGADWGESDP